MKKCVYCETKKMKEYSKSPTKFFGRCDYCVNRNKLSEERNAKILREKRAAFYEAWLGGTGY